MDQPKGTPALASWFKALNLVESLSSDYLYAIEFRLDDLASRALRVGLTTFFQNLDLSRLAARSSGLL